MRRLSATPLPRARFRRGAALAVVCAMAPLTVGCTTSVSGTGGAASTRAAEVTLLPVPVPSPRAAPVERAAATYLVTAGGAVRPDPRTTPGAMVDPASRAVVCKDDYTKAIHAPRYNDKLQAFDLYGISIRKRDVYRLDHLVPVSLGGSNALENLWPQPKTRGRGSQEKDRLEQRLRTLVCAGSLPLETSHRALTGDWWAAYQTYVVEPDRAATGLGPAAGA